MDEPSGVSGFGRGTLSMPSQLSHQNIIGKDRFSYCLQSHHFDDENHEILLVQGDKALPRDISLNYSPFIINTRASYGYLTFYYIDLKAVNIGRKCSNLPCKLFRFDSKGNGGTIIYLGTNFSIFNKETYENIMNLFPSHNSLIRASDIEARIGMVLCYNFSGVDNSLLPEFAFHFNSSSDMVLPVANYFSYVVSFDYIYLTMYSSIVLNSEADRGPVVILGNY